MVLELDYVDEYEGVREALYKDPSFIVPLLGEDELEDGILYDSYWCPLPAREDILTYVEREYLTSRGYELGTVSCLGHLNSYKQQS